jgi:2-amino-4-hydroxy-6-hydroxymethyldihydropteridine diphosphokinase
MDAVPAQPVTAAIALGSNLGDRRAHLAAALDAIARLPGAHLIAASDFIQTEPVGPVPQGPFLNAAAVVETTLPPSALLESLLRIESSRGRDRAREQRWGPRTLDLDLLVHGDRVICEAGLTIPHPRLHERLFVLEPLAQIASELRIPPGGRTVRELLLARRANPTPTQTVQPPAP